MNPISELNELVQKLYGKSIKTKVLSKDGADHIPTVKVEISLPNGQTFTASGANKRLAKQKASEEALLILTTKL